jgi:hypothetical protein
VRGIISWTSFRIQIKLKYSKELLLGGVVEFLGYHVVTVGCHTAFVGPNKSKEANQISVNYNTVWIGVILPIAIR